MSLPEQISRAIHDSYRYLVTVLNAHILESETHRTIIVTGLNNDNNTRREISRYLVGLRASAIDAALNIRSNLIEDTREGYISLLEDIYSLVGEENNLTEDQVQDERNPWLSEGIWHLCLNISRDKANFHPHGAVIAINYPHIAAKDHGLDVIAIFENEGNLGLSFVESKAYKNDPNRAINKSVLFFKEVDNGKHSTRIKQCVQVMRASLSTEKQRLVTGLFWHRNRCYIPNPHYDTSITINWSNKRPSFTELAVDRTDIIVMPHIIDNFDSFFDAIADEMRAFVRGLYNVR